MGEGNAEDLISLAKATVKKTKMQLEIVMARHLAIVDPRNGQEFVGSPNYKYSLTNTPK